MDQQRLHSELEQVFRAVFDREDLSLSDETTAADVDGWDSLAQINIVVGVEDAFKVRFTTAEIKALQNVGEFKRLIAAKLAGG